MVLGACAAGAGAASADANFTFERVAGPDRYATSAKIADKFGDATNAILASGEPGHYPDALTANYLAGVQSAPILLTQKDETPASVLAQLKDSKVKNITIVGGVLAVSAAQEQALKDADYTVKRVSGQTRSNTNADIIKEGGDAKSDTALVATGFNFPDALAAGPLAYDEGMPVGITNKADMPDDVIAALKAAGIDKAIVLGGEIAVPKSVVDELEAKDIKVITRLSGQSRSATAVAVADYAVKNLGFSVEHVNAASGRAFGDGADALAGGPLSGESESPILVTENASVAGPAVLDYLKRHANTLDDGYLFGGPLAITESLKKALEAAAQTVTSNQDFTVTPADEVTLETVAAGDEPSSTDNRTYTVSGLDSASTYNVRLLPAENVKVDANGQVSFVDADGNNVADNGSTNAKITVVNGSSNGTTSAIVSPVNGGISFTVDYDNAAPEEIIPVIWKDAETTGDNQLDLVAPASSNTDAKQPSEDFGIGGQTNWTPAEAGFGWSGTVEVQRVNKAADSFVAGDETYYYGSDDVFYAENGVRLSFAQFETSLNVGDTVSTDYNPEGPSDFWFEDDAPQAAQNVTATNQDTDNDGTADDVLVNWDAAPGAAFDVTTYDVQRAPVSSTGVVGTYANVTGGTGLTATEFKDQNLSAGTYSYQIITKDNDANTETSEAARATVPAGADKTAPTVTGVTSSDAAPTGTLGSGDQVAVTFDEKVVVASNASFTFRDNDGSVGTVTRGGNATMSTNAAGTTVFITLTGTPVPEAAGTTLGLDPANIKVVNSGGVADAGGNQLAEVTVTATDPAAADLTVVFTANSPVDAASVTVSDFTTTGTRTVSSVAVTGSTITVTMSGALAAGDTVTLKADSVANTDGGNGPAAAVTATA